jgi:hypothetical protein
MIHRLNEHMDTTDNKLNKVIGKLRKLVWSWSLFLCCKSFLIHNLFQFHLDDQNQNHCHFRFVTKHVIVNLFCHEMKHSKSLWWMYDWIWLIRND